MSKSKEFLKESKSEISKRIIHALKTRKKQFNADVPWVKETYPILQKFVCNGKMIRGGLFLLACKMFGETISEKHLDIAAGIEFFHSCLLIHDDIMDNDYIRRGEPTIFAKFEEEASKRAIKEPRLYGNSMATCIGDISLFIAYGLISQAKTDNTTYHKFLAYFTKEAELVGFGQMQDFHLSKQQKEPTEADILSVYRYKTARYTFSMPIALSALLTNQDDEIISTLEKIGEYAGMIFQIRDDELRYFSEETQIGKTVGSDVRENTKTLFRHYLFESVTPVEKKKLLRIFGNPDANSSDLLYVRRMLEEKGVVKKIQKLLIEYRSEANTRIMQLPIKSEYRILFIDLIEYMYVRNK